MRPLALVVLLACTPDAADTGPGIRVLPNVEVVSWMADGAAEGPVRIEADWYAQPEADAPAVVLVHCDWPAPADRTGWPVDLIRDLRAARLAVLVPDMRGFGASEGEWLGFPASPLPYNDLVPIARWLESRGATRHSMLACGNFGMILAAYVYQTTTLPDLPPTPPAVGYLGVGPATEAWVRMELWPRIPTLMIGVVWEGGETNWADRLKALNRDKDVYVDGWECSTDCIRESLARYPNLQGDIVDFYATNLVEPE